MIRLFIAALCVATFSLTGCENRTRDGVRWDQIAEAQKTSKDVQPWSEARSPWSEIEHHSGLAW
jgi:predicted small secreted protein